MRKKAMQGVLILFVILGSAYLWAEEQVSRPEAVVEKPVKNDQEEQQGRQERGMGRRGRGMRPDQERLRRGSPDVPMIKSTPLPKNEEEKTILNVLEDIRANQGGRMQNVPMEDGRLLRLLAETMDAKHVVEIGTSNGYSSLWLCLALQTTGGKLTTYEIDHERVVLARENFKRAGVEQMVTIVEGDAHQEVPKIKESIDMLFLDADKKGYLDYLNKLLPLVRPGGLIVGHNINSRQADPDYIKAITTNPDLETLFLNTQGTGVGVTLKKR